MERRTARAWCWLGALLLTWPVFGSDNPFDPRGFITKQEVLETKDAKLLSRAIYRIDGLRYQKFVSANGAVWLKSTDAVPDVTEAAALCAVHLRLMREALLVRDHLPIAASHAQVAPAIIALIAKCSEGRIPGPTLVVTTPDGAQVEMKAKDASAERF